LSISIEHILDHIPDHILQIILIINQIYYNQKAYLRLGTEVLTAKVDYNKDPSLPYIQSTFVHLFILYPFILPLYPSSLSSLSILSLSSFSILSLYPPSLSFLSILFLYPPSLSPIFDALAREEAEIPGLNLTYSHAVLCP
jgi:hypothetical protein